MVFLLFRRTMGRLHLLALVFLTASLLLTDASEKPSHHLLANETSAKSNEMTTIRKEQRLNLGGGLLGQ